MPSAWAWLYAAWAVALVATLGALYIGEVLGQTPCVLCWYQRILMFPLALILGMAAFQADRRGAVYALPFAVGGIGFAGWHSALFAGWVPATWLPCGPAGSCGGDSQLVFGGLPIPWLSLAAFVLIAAALFIHLHRTRSS